MTIEAVESRIKELEALVATPITNGMMYRLELARLKAQHVDMLVNNCWASKDYSDVKE